MTHKNSFIADASPEDMRTSPRTDEEFEAMSPEEFLEIYGFAKAHLAGMDPEDRARINLGFLPFIAS